jgi:hypothetical protein
MKKLATSIFCFILVIGALNAQSTAKFNLKVGYSVFQIADEDGIFENRSHTTQHAGFDVLIEKNNWLFIPGFHYYRIGLEPEDFKTSELFSKRPYGNFAKMPISFGYHFRQTPVISFSAYGGGSANFFLRVDENDSGLTNDRFKGIHLNAHIGAQILIVNHITVDFLYEHGFMPIYKTRDESKISGFTLSLGFVF